MACTHSPPSPGAYVREEEEDARHRSYLQQLRGLERQALHARVAADLAGMRAPRAAPHSRGAGAVENCGLICEDLVSRMTTHDLFVPLAPPRDGK